MRKLFYLLIIVLFVLPLIFSFFVATDRARISDITQMLAGVFFIDSVTAAQLREDYAKAKSGNEKIKILVVPGHDKDAWGTQFKGTKEVELNLELAQYLTQFLRRDPAFYTILAQNDDGYDPVIESYFSNERGSIKSFRKKQKDIMDKMVSFGLIDIKRGVEHINAPSETAIKLYGINKWSNENGIDIILHVHFNDEPTRRYNREGKYEGFAVYIPERQFSNAKASRALAEKVFTALKSRFPQSDMPLEKSGIVEDQELIAIGAYNSLNAAVLFIEYGYIYEPQFINKATRSVALKEAALQTYLGIQDFFGNEISGNNETQKILFPYKWEKNLKYGMRGDKDVFLLQTALLIEGVYPPEGSTKQDCPISGNFFGCTKRAVELFQKKYGIEQNGLVGPITRARLNDIYNK